MAHATAKPGHGMLLISAIAILAAVAAMGAWLAARTLFSDEPPPIGLNWRGLAHGASGLAGFAVLVAALRGPQPSLHAVRMGVGAFGLFSGALVAGAALAGLAIVATHLRRRAIPVALVATHGLLGITGLTLLLTYLTMLS